MAVHRLKTWPPFFRDVRDGKKTFELRKNDRQFSAGDLLVLREWDPETEKYSGHKLYCRVPYLVAQPSFGGLTEGHVCMSLRLLEYPVFLVLEAATRRGVDLTDEEAGWLLWNETGYPSFWKDGMEADIRRQITEWCERKKERHG